MRQSEVARCLGVSKSVVSREVSTDWTLERLLALARGEAEEAAS
jgi:predicted transcriptional regulator